MLKQIKRQQELKAQEVGGEGGARQDNDDESDEDGEDFVMLPAMKKMK